MDEDGLSLGAKERGCGMRQKGGIYLECGGGFGLPIYLRICDPVKPVDVEEIGLGSVGVKLFQDESGTYHVMDWVGEKHYPNATDYLEEMVRLGVSRRISRKEDFSLLGPGSMLFLVHPKAYLPDLTWEFQDTADGGWYLFNGPEWLEEREWPCPTGKHKPGPDQEECAGLCWMIADPGSTDGLAVDGKLPEMQEPTFPEWAPKPVHVFNGVGTRTQPSFTYRTAERPAGEALQMTPGVIAIVPIERLAVIDDPEDPENIQQSMDAARASKLPVRKEDQ